MQGLYTYLPGLSEVVFQWNISALSPPQLVVTYLFYRFVAEFADRFLEIVPELLDHLTTFMTSGSVPQVLSTVFSACLIRFARTIVRCPSDVIVPATVERFIMAMQPDFVAVGSILLKGLSADDAAAELIRYVQVFSAALASESEKSDVCFLALEFLGVIPHEWLLKLEPVRQNLIEFYQGLEQVATADPELLCKYIRASCPVLGSDCPLAILPIADMIVSPAAVQSACVALGSALRADTNAGIDAATLLPLVASFMPIVQDGLDDPELVQSFLDLAGQVVWRVPQPDIVEALCEIVKDFLNRKFDVVPVLVACIGFVANIASHFPDQAIQMFTAPVFNGIFADGFCPVRPVWETYTQKVWTIHQKLMKVSPDEFHEVFVEAVRALGGSDDFAHKYLRSDHLAGPMKGYKHRILFQELAESFHGMPS
jgi:hypothetical protein